MLFRVVNPRKGSWIVASARRAVVSRRIFPYLALVTFGLAALAGFVVTLVDKQDFPTFGTGVWWAVVTLGTVGYGDVVPQTPWGRVIGSIVIVFGVTFISFLTATVTSAFIAAEEEEARAAEQARQEEVEEELRQLLGAIADRLAAIETKLERGP
jgi:voltage-gated potassium channel